MPRWSATDIPDLSGRCAVVTGASSGLGLETAAALAARGARVVMACRNPARAEEAHRLVSAQAQGLAPEVMLLDLADLGSVRAFSAGLAEAVDELDVLVNNAGIMAVPRALTVDGFELQFGTNHLGHFALSALVLPLLSHRGRVVTVSSTVAHAGHIHFEDLQGEHGYNRWQAYAQSKLANLLFAFELDRRLRAPGSQRISVAAHPGFAATNLQSAGPAARGSRRGVLFSQVANRLFAQPAAAGALPSLYAATAPGVAGGDYIGPDGLAHQRGHPTKVTPPKAAGDRAVAERLWAVSELLTGISFPPLAER